MLWSIFSERLNASLPQLSISPYLLPLIPFTSRQRNKARRLKHSQFSFLNREWKLKADQLRISATENCSWADAVSKKRWLLASDLSFRGSCLCIDIRRIYSNPFHWDESFSVDWSDITSLNTKSFIQVRQLSCLETSLWSPINILEICTGLEPQTGPKTLKLIFGDWIWILINEFEDPEAGGRGGQREVAGQCMARWQLWGGVGGSFWSACINNLFDCHWFSLANRHWTL